MTRQDVMDTAKKYIDGLKGTEVNTIPFGSDITLTENGKVMARGMEEVRKRLAANAQAVKAVHIQKWVIEGGDAIALCQIDTNDGRVQMHFQYLRIYDGLIREAQANFGRKPTEEEIERYRAAARRSQAA